MGASVVSVSAECRLSVGRIFQATPSFLLFNNCLSSRVSRVSGNSYLAVHMRPHMRMCGRAGARAMCRGVFSRHSRHFLDRSYMQQGLNGCRLMFFRRHSGDTFWVQPTLLCP